MSTIKSVPKDVLLYEIIPNLQEPLLKRIQELEKKIEQFNLYEKIITHNHDVCHIHEEGKICNGKIIGVVNCENCEEPVCESHKYRCEECDGEPFCDYCLKECKVCYEWVCENCFIGCDHCETYSCINCLEQKQKCMDCEVIDCDCNFLIDEKDNTTICMGCCGEYKLKCGVPECTSGFAWTPSSPRCANSRDEMR